jgi:hypothetical protein
MKTINNLPLLELMVIERMTIEQMLDIRGKTDTVDLSQDAVLPKSDLYERMTGIFWNILVKLGRHLRRKYVPFPGASQPR